MLRKSCICALISIALVSALQGCEGGKRAFLIATVCLQSADDLSAFTAEMQSAANAEGTEFLDWSAETQAELDTIGHPMDGARTRPAINMGFTRRDGVGLTAGNLGLPGYQVALGFSKGSNAPAAHKLAQRIVSKLEERWHVEIVPNPAESGAFPMTNCPEK
ncbi:MAG: hypothetical protein ACREYD_03330 [Casimicrobiaceae bacterium]